MDPRWQLKSDPAAADHTDHVDHQLATQLCTCGARVVHASLTCKNATIQWISMHVTAATELPLAS